MKQKNMNVFENLNCIIFILIYAFRSVTDALFVANGESSFLVNVKYILIMMAIIFCVLQKKKSNNYFKKEINTIFLVIIILSIISIFSALANNNFYADTLENIFKMVLPFIYVYFFINTVEYEKIYQAMAGAMIASFIGYMIEIGTRKFYFSKFKND